MLARSALRPVGQSSAARGHPPCPGCQVVGRSDLAAVEVVGKVFKVQEELAFLQKRLSISCLNPGSRLSGVATLYCWGSTPLHCPSQLSCHNHTRLYHLEALQGRAQLADEDGELRGALAGG